MKGIDKGKAFERLIANKFTEALGIECKRELAQSRGGSEGPDIGVPNWWIECKHRDHVDVKKSLIQAGNDASGTNRRPAVVYRVTGARSIRVALYDPAWCAIVEMDLDPFLAHLGRNSVTSNSK